MLNNVVSIINIVFANDANISLYFEKKTIILLLFMFVASTCNEKKRQRKNVGNYYREYDYYCEKTFWRKHIIWEIWLRTNCEIFILFLSQNQNIYFFFYSSLSLFSKNNITIVWRTFGAFVSLFRESVTLSKISFLEFIISLKSGLLMIVLLNWIRNFLYIILKL